MEWETKTMTESCGDSSDSKIPNDIRELIAAAFAEADRARDRARSLSEMVKIIYGLDEDARFRLTISIHSGQGIGSPDRAGEE